MRGFILSSLLSCFAGVAFAQGTITTIHPSAPQQPTAISGPSGYMAKSNNLSDVSNVATARSNLGLSSSSTIDTTNANNITSGTLVAGRLPAFAAGDVTSSAGSAVLSIVNGHVTAAKMASGAAVGNLGFTPANKAGDTFTGNVNLSAGLSFQIGTLPLLGLGSPVVYVHDYTTDNACAGNVTTSIQAAINAAQAFATGGQVVFDKGSYCFSALSLTGSNIRLSGDSAGTLLLMNDTSSNGITIGSGSAIIDNITLENLTVWTKTGITKSGGAAILGYYTRNLTLNNVNIGTKALLTAASGVPKIYNGLVTAGFDSVRANGVNIIGNINDCLTIYGQPNTPQSDPTHDYGTEWHWTGGGQIVQCGHFGAHIAGGAGGVHFESGGISLASYGMYVDRSLDSLTTANPQITIDPGFAIDTNTNDGIHFENSSYGQVAIKGWVSSNTGNGISNTATQNAGSLIMLSGAQILFNGIHGVDALGGTWNVGGGSSLTQNGGSGFLAFGAGVTSVNIADARLDSNTSYGIDDQSSGNLVSINPSVSLLSNGTAAYRTISGLLSLSAPLMLGKLTVATLPTCNAAAKGTLYAVTDGTGALAWGATVTGGSSTYYTVNCNAANWTVMGK